MKKHNSTILLILSIFIFISCNNQHCPNNNVEVSDNNNIKLHEAQKDTIPQLKFNSMVRSIFEDSKGVF